jgi:hypothetical protein
MRVQFFGDPKDGHERKLPDNIQAQSYEWRFPLPYPQVVQASDYYVKYLVPFPVFISNIKTATSTAGKLAANSLFTRE